MSSDVTASSKSKPIPRVNPGWFGWENVNIKGQDEQRGADRKPPEKPKSHKAKEAQGLV